MHLTYLTKIPDSLSAKETDIVSEAAEKLLTDKPSDTLNTLAFYLEKDRACYMVGYNIYAIAWVLDSADLDKVIDLVQAGKQKDGVSHLWQSAYIILHIDWNGESLPEFYKFFESWGSGK